MAVKIRLARHGAKKKPYYRVIVTDARNRRDGSFIEQVGRYNPCVDPAYVELDFAKIDAWIKNGAQPTERVSYLISKYRNPEFTVAAVAEAVTEAAEEVAEVEAAAEEVAEAPEVEAAEEAAEVEAAAEEAAEAEPSTEVDDA